VVPQIIQALIPAVDEGLHIPLVYNSGGYDHVSTLQFLEGIFDIYMPDFKFWDSNVSSETCKAPNYPEVAKLAVSEMYRQAGDLEINSGGIAERGLLVRHLVMPGGIAGTEKIMEFLSREVSTDTYVNIMPQYRPCGGAWENSRLNRSISMSEFKLAIQDGINAGISRLDQE